MGIFHCYVSLLEGTCRCWCHLSSNRPTAPASCLLAKELMSRHPKVAALSIFRWFQGLSGFNDFFREWLLRFGICWVCCPSQFQNMPFRIYGITLVLMMEFSIMRFGISTLIFHQTCAHLFGRNVIWPVVIRCPGRSLPRRWHELEFNHHFGSYHAMYFKKIIIIFQIHPGRLTWNIIMEAWKIIFLSKWVICRFHVNLPGCNGSWSRAEPQQPSTVLPRLLICRSLAAKCWGAPQLGMTTGFWILMLIRSCQSYRNIYIYNYTMYIHIFLPTPNTYSTCRYIHIYINIIMRDANVTWTSDIVVSAASGAKSVLRCRQTHLLPRWATEAGVSWSDPTSGLENHPKHDLNNYKILQDTTNNLYASPTLNLDLDKSEHHETFELPGDDTLDEEAAEVPLCVEQKSCNRSEEKTVF